MLLTCSSQLQKCQQVKLQISVISVTEAACNIQAHEHLEQAKMVYTLHILSYQPAGFRFTHTGNKMMLNNHMAGNFHIVKFIQVLTHMVQTYHQLPFNFMRSDSTVFMLIFFLEGLQLLFLPSFTLFFQLLLLLPELLSRKKETKVCKHQEIKRWSLYLFLCTQWRHGEKWDIAPLILNCSTRQKQVISSSRPSHSYFLWLDNPSGPRSPHCWDFGITLRHTRGRIPL